MKGDPWELEMEVSEINMKKYTPRVDVQEWVESPESREGSMGLV